MARFRGSLAGKPEGEHQWPILNGLLFGDQSIGGQHVSVREDVLPLAWPEIFGRKSSLSLEIGFNRGRFLTALAERFPEQNFVGIEIRRRYCWRIAHDMAHGIQPIDNLRVIWADAKAVTQDIFGQAVLHNIYITFPDPWWKKKHAKRKLIDTRFADELAALLEVGGHIWVKTDVAQVATEIADALAAAPVLSAATGFEEGDLPLTHREVNCIALGMPIHRFKVTRKSPL
jgi:tRNA (guanine-N7-)-methyltransferase